MTPNERIALLLAAHSPQDSKEKTDIQLIQRLLLTTGNLMDQRHPPAHITGSALVLNAYNGRFLLHYHKRLNRWLQFGGHAEPHETDPSQTALREAMEESGLQDLRFLRELPLDIDVHTIPTRGDEPEHLHLDFRYALQTEAPQAVSVGKDEARQFRWFDLQTAQEQQLELDPALWRLIDKAVRVYKALVK